MRFFAGIIAGLVVVAPSIAFGQQVASDQRLAIAKEIAQASETYWDSDLQGVLRIFDSKSNAEDVRWNGPTEWDDNVVEHGSFRSASRQNGLNALVFSLEYSPTRDVSGKLAVEAYLSVSVSADACPTMQAVGDAVHSAPIRVQDEPIGPAVDRIVLKRSDGSTVHIVHEQGRACTFQIVSRRILDVIMPGATPH